MEEKSLGKPRVIYITDRVMRRHDALGTSNKKSGKWDTNMIEGINRYLLLLPLHCPSYLTGCIKSIL